jgi:hypothetical protein
MVKLTTENNGILICRHPSVNCQFQRNPIGIMLQMPAIPSDGTLQIAFSQIPFHFDALPHWSIKFDSIGVVEEIKSTLNVSFWTN